MDLPQPKKTLHPPSNSTNQWKDHQRMLFNTAYSHADQVSSYGFSSPRTNPWDTNGGPFMQSNKPDGRRRDAGLVCEDM
ncbi:hypothetical protein INT44_006281 [Umbelopsis vinacea]|uniref:Uncharacterized protein n=1 Tax=Umbelopsis vinacea TaxID=44442 RepID=A0A8H7UDY4_9FUNG|nr:hypothetical protein INT44_006281 [Umbelopsis vinacea]